MHSTFLLRYQEPILFRSAADLGTQTITESREQRVNSDSILFLYTQTGTRGREQSEADCAGQGHAAVPLVILSDLSTMTATGTRETKDRDDGVERRLCAVPKL